MTIAIWPWMYHIKSTNKICINTTFSYLSNFINKICVSITFSPWWLWYFHIHPLRSFVCDVIRRGINLTWQHLLGCRGMNFFGKRCRPLDWAKGILRWYHISINRLTTIECFKVSTPRGSAATRISHCAKPADYAGITRVSGGFFMSLTWVSIGICRPCE